MGPVADADDAPLVHYGIAPHESEVLGPDVLVALGGLGIAPAVVEDNHLAGLVLDAGDDLEAQKDLPRPVLLDVPYQDGAVGRGVLTGHNRVAGKERPGEGTEKEEYET